MQDTPNVAWKLPGKDGAREHVEEGYGTFAEGTSNSAADLRQSVNFQL